MQRSLFLALYIFNRMFNKLRILIDIFCIYIFFQISSFFRLVLYINNNNVITDIVLNDGYWHHLCVTWRSLNGSYAFFVDGKLAQNGTNFCRGQTIDGKVLYNYIDHFNFWKIYKNFLYLFLLDIKDMCNNSEKIEREGV